MNSSASHALGEFHPESPGWIDQLEIAIAASGNSDDKAYADIRIDQSDRVPIAPDGRECPHIRWAKLLIVLAASSCLASAALLGGQRFLTHDGVASPRPVPTPNAPAGIPGSSKGHHLVSHPAIVRETDRAATARMPAGPNVRPPVRVAHVKPARTLAPPAASATNYVPPAPPAPLPEASAEKPNMEARLTPVPETRPTTIAGWVLRDVVNGTAVLEGPDGLRTVKRGDMVPGIGQIVDIFGWGNRLIVATSTGLISTP